MAYNSKANPESTHPLLISAAKEVQLESNNPNNYELECTSAIVKPETRNSRKQKRNLGQPYTSSNGKYIRARMMQPLTKCRNNCREKISDEERKTIFTRYWKLGNYTERCCYVSSMISVNYKASHRPKCPDVEKQRFRQITYKYLLEIDDKRIKVCKMCFIKTLDESQNFLNLVGLKKRSAEIDYPLKNTFKNKLSKRRKFSETSSPSEHENHYQYGRSYEESSNTSSTDSHLNQTKSDEFILDNTATSPHPSDLVYSNNNSISNSSHSQILPEDFQMENYNKNSVSEIRIKEKPESRNEKIIKRKNVRKESKEKRNFGKSYITSKGKVIPARKLQPLDKCRNKCKEILTEKNRQRIFNEYWLLGNYLRRCSYVASMMNVKQKVYFRPRFSDPERQKFRQITYQYFFVINGKRIIVCKGCFLKTLNESPKFIQLVGLKKRADAYSKGDFQTLPSESNKYQKRPFQIKLFPNYKQYTTPSRRNSIKEDTISTETYNTTLSLKKYNSSKKKFQKNRRENHFKDTIMDAKQSHNEQDPEFPEVTKNVRTARKEKRNRGQSYVTSKGKVIRARKLQPLGKCRNNCKSKLTEDIRERLFKSYWNLGNYEKRCTYVASLISVNNKASVRTKYANSDRQKFREITYKYYFDVDGSQIKVCKSCFLKTLDESGSFVKTVGYKKRTISEGVPFKDQRGKAEPRRKWSEVKQNQNDMPKYAEYFIDDTVMDTEQSLNKSDSHVVDVRNLNQSEESEEYFIDNNIILDLQHKQISENDNKSSLQLISIDTSNEVLSNSTLTVRNNVSSATKERKEKKNRGQSYITPKGKLIRARKMQPLGKCRNNCKSKLSEYNRKVLFKSYWNLGTYEKRCSYVASLISINNKASFGPKCANVDRQKCREITYKYYFDVDGSRIKVCKRCFLKTLDESDSFVKTVGYKKRTTSEGIPFKDERGKATPRTKSSEENLFQKDKLIPKNEEYFIEDTKQTPNGSDKRQVNDVTNLNPYEDFKYKNIKSEVSFFDNKTILDLEHKQIQLENPEFDIESSWRLIESNTKNEIWNDGGQSYITSKGKLINDEKYFEETIMDTEESNNEQDPELAEVTKNVRTARKEKRNLGQSYVTSKGKLIKARKLQPLGKCRNNCNSKLNENIRKRLFKSYWNLGNYEKRCSYVASLISVSNKASFRPKYDNSDRQRFREITYKYYFDVDGSRIKVCKSCFLKTLDESGSFLKHVGLKKRSTSEDVPFKDGRGKASARKKFSEENLPLQKDKLLPKKEEYFIENRIIDTESSHNESYLEYEIVHTNENRNYKEPFINETIISGIGPEQIKFEISEFNIESNFPLVENHTNNDESDDIETTLSLTNNVRKARKEKKNHGESYITSKGKVIRSKKLQPLDKCRNDCKSKLSEDKRVVLFTDYWNLGNYAKRCSYVASLITVNEKTSFRPRCADIEKQIFRQITYKYYFEVDGSRIKVCKRCFLKTLDETESFVSLVGLKKRTMSEGDLWKDGRGNAPPKNKWSEEKLIEVQNHIMSFSGIFNNSNCPNFSEKSILNISKLYDHYRECTAIPVGQRTYYQEFHKINN